MTEIKCLNSQDAGFRAELERLLAWEQSVDPAVEETVRGIINAVQTRGDAALLEYTRRFDRWPAVVQQLELAPDTRTAALDRIEPGQRAALEFAAQRIRGYALHQKLESWSYTEADGTLLGQQVTPMDRVGLYVPGGKAAYPSSVLMNAIPAKVAGVAELIMVVPTPDGEVNDMVLAAAAVAGVDRVFAIGGAQAVAALAYGTATVPAVDKIVGPGNVWVATAKRMVFGRVGIDMIAGPSEIVVVADGAQDPKWIAADLLSQAEHDELAQAVLITDSAVLADAVAAAVERQLSALPRGAIAGASWRDLGAIIVVHDLMDAPALVDRLAPEHLELLVAEPDAMAERIHNAGAIFLGPHTPEVIGDYVGGPNHVLPTDRSARFASGLSVYDFLKRTTWLACPKRAFAALGPAAAELARAEGLAGHAEAVMQRLSTTRSG
jgi:histidinol dehydrogenase